jgi:NTE family protein
MGSRDRVGLVLSGGGARGAYEVGVLDYLADQLPDLLRRIRVVTGTSVGAVNGAFLASHELELSAVKELVRLWSELSIDAMLKLDRPGVQALLRAGALRLTGRGVTSPPVGLLSVEGIAKLVLDEVDWRRLSRAVQHGRLDAVGLAATDVATGRTHLFVDHHDSLTPSWSRGEDSPIAVRTRLTPAHVLASAAIPLIFPPVQVGDRWYMDGGLRNNTPVSPALCLAADALLIVSVRAPVERHEVPLGSGWPGFGQVVGKVLDSVFLDRVSFDLDRLVKLNDFVDAAAATGDEQAARAVLAARGRKAYRHVPFAHVRPSRDLGAMASTHLAAVVGKRPLSIARLLRALFQDDAGSTGDAASFLLFDGAYARALIDVGRADAAANHATLAKL